MNGSVFTALGLDQSSPGYLTDAWREFTSNDRYTSTSLDFQYLFTEVHNWKDAEALFDSFPHPAGKEMFRRFFETGWISDDSAPIQNLRRSPISPDDALQNTEDLLSAWCLALSNDDSDWEELEYWDGINLEYIEDYFSRDWDLPGLGVYTNTIECLCIDRLGDSGLKGALSLLDIFRGVNRDPAYGIFVVEPIIGIPLGGRFFETLFKAGSCFATDEHTKSVFVSSLPDDLDAIES